MKVTDMTLFKMQAARIRIPSSGTRMFVAGRAQSGSLQDDADNECPERVNSAEIREILRANRGPMRPASIAALLNADTKAVSQALRAMAKQGVVKQTRAPRGASCIYELS